MMQIIRATDYEDMSRKAANILRAQVVLKPDCVLGLATGSSPVGAYRRLVEWYQQGEIDFSGVRTVNLDEYVGLPPENDQSYRYFMQRHLFGQVNLRTGSTHVPNGLEEDAAYECTRYEQLIASLGGVDLQLLGLGHNGHIGFNEPGAEFVKDTHLVQLAQKTIEANRRFFASPDDVPRRAYTMGIRTILQARAVVMVVSGQDKAAILQQSFFGPVTPEVPASILQMHPRVTVVADEAALSAL